MLITLDEARSRLLDQLRAMPGEQVGYAEAAHRILAAPLLAARTQPPFDASAMDGFAVHSADLSDTPTALPLAGEAAAGHGFKGALPRGQAARISTGAPLPEGADQIVIQENTERSGDVVRIQDGPRPGAHIRRAGVDFASGDLLRPAGARITGETVALMAGAGLTSADVHARPRVGILSTGDELVEPGEATGPDQIINSISKGLEALVREWGGDPVYLGIARDNEASVRDALERASGLDLVVTIGGASVGDHDHLRRVFANQGGMLAFEKIAVKPGKPTWSGQLGDSVYLGLPGNPVSALVIARLLLKPALATLTGRGDTPVFQTARCVCDLPANGPRETFLRARFVAPGEVEPVANQDSSVLTALVASNGLIRRPIDAKAVAAGEIVDVLAL